MFAAKYKTLPEAWVGLMDAIMKHGDYALTQYGNNARYLSGTLIEITEYVEQWHKRDPICSKNYLREYKKEFRETPTDLGFSYTYGNRIHKYPCMAQEPGFTHLFRLNQVDAIVNALKKGTNDSRRLQVITWIPRVDQFSDEPPCLQRLHFYPHANKLDVNVSYRSQDIFGALEANLIGIASLVEEEILNVTPYKLGAYRLYCDNSHVYERDWGAVESILNS
jgi:thymidylate synthase